MRYNVLSKKSTKAERLVYESLKRLRVDFKHRWIVAGREVDFLVGTTALEIDGHEQDIVKNRILAEAGYRPLHLSNAEIKLHKGDLTGFIKNYLDL